MRWNVVGEVMALLGVSPRAIVWCGTVLCVYLATRESYIQLQLGTSDSGS